MSLALVDVPVSAAPGHIKKVIASNNALANADGAAQDAYRATTGAGTSVGTGVVATEYCAQPGFRKTVLTLTNLTVAGVDAAGATGHLSQQVYDFPAGLILMLGATLSLVITKSSAGVNADWDGDIGLGTAAEDGGATPLATTEQDLLPNTATPQAVAGVCTVTGISTTTENVVFNGTTTAKDMFLNLLIDDADQDMTGTPCNMIFNGTITFWWINLGDV